MKQDNIHIFTDGACSGNPGPGGWGAVIQFNEKDIELSGAEFETTNNRMELTAVIKALTEITVPAEIEITTDSKYVLDGITKWLKGWKMKNWKTAANKPVKNVDLWMELDRLQDIHKINWKWIKGHAGHEENERCDELARRAIKELKNSEIY
jgi:ribonuclease HI